MAPKGTGVRPTSDSLRETLFNVLGDVTSGARVLDAYAGTGALGLEALSRGAAHVTFVERDRAAVETIAGNVAGLEARGACAIIRADFAALDHQPFDLVLLDPPYEAADLEAIVARGSRFVAPGGRLVLEHSRRRESPELVPGLRRIRVLTAGDSTLSFYVTDSAPASR